MPVRVPARLLLAVVLSLSIDVKAQQQQQPQNFEPQNSERQTSERQTSEPQTPEPLTVEKLAAKLVDEPDAAGRDALLSAHADLVGAPLAQALLLAGREARNAGSIERARRAYELMADIGIKANVPAQHALALNNIGLLAYDQGDYQEALDWYAKSLAISEQNGDDTGAARTLNNIGAAYSFANALDSARPPLERSLAIGDRLKNPRLVANALNNLAVLDGMRGDYARALSVLQRSYNLEASSGSPRNLAITRLNIGNVYLNQGDDTQAAQQFEQALALADKLGVRQLSAIALMGLGNVALERGDVADAVRQFERSLVVFREINDKPNIANTLSMLATALGGDGHYDRALVMLRESIELQKTIGGSDLPRILTRVAAMHNGAKQYREALNAAKQAITLAAPRELREALWRGHLEAARAHAGLAEAKTAEAELSRAITVIEDLRHHVAGGELEQRTFFENKLAPYHELIGLLVAQRRYAEAFTYAERARSRVLVDVFRSGRTPLATLTADEAARDQQFQIRLASLNARVLREQGIDSGSASGGGSGSGSGSGNGADPKRSSVDPKRPNIAAERDAVRLEYEAFRTGLYARHARLKLERGETNPLTLSDAVAVSRARQSAIVEFMVTEAQTYAFVLDGERPQARVQAFVLPISRKALTARVDELVKQITNRDVAFRAAAIDLHRILLGEVTRRLTPGRALIVVPDGVLWQLPFQALLAPSGLYLIYERMVTYAPSVSALKLMIAAKQQRGPQSATRLLAFGNPAWNTASSGADAAPSAANSGESTPPAAALRAETFTPLPHAEDEVKQLGHLYGDASSLVRIGAEAAESRFKDEAKAADVLHLATHGVLNDASPLYSYLLMASTAEGDRNDGLLEARELLRLDLRASLAVLSACDTARGRVAAGEGVVGFSWALFVAGVPTVVVSQWKVDSASTSELMVEFHRRRRAGESDARAMQGAVRTLRENPAYRHPFFWAPFIVVGAA
jgi:CHAT domain-containing protein/tetratricopeptide (TPR) repeat protein